MVYALGRHSKAIHPAQASSGGGLAAVLAIPTWSCGALTWVQGDQQLSPYRGMSHRRQYHCWRDTLDFSMIGLADSTNRQVLVPSP